jgi:uncharacterized protein (DUF952 family)
MILHIATREQWQAAAAAGSYRGDTLDVQGFIHCSRAEQVVAVANARFRGRSDLVLLSIDESLLESELRYEEGEPGQLFPHIYGPLNLNAVVNVVNFLPGSDGTFSLPR